MHQSNALNNGKPTEIELEYMICNNCKCDCITGCIDYSTAFYGKCPKCDMEYFK